MKKNQQQCYCDCLSRVLVHFVVLFNCAYSFQFEGRESQPYDDTSILAPTPQAATTRFSSTTTSNPTIVLRRRQFHSPPLELLEFDALIVLLCSLCFIFFFVLL